MSLKNTIFYFVTVTMVCILYVHLQTRIIELGYEVKERQESFTKILDHNKILINNINVLSSPLNLDRVLISKKMDLGAVAEYRKVTLVKKVTPMEKVVDQSNKFLTLISNVFTPKAQAEASTVKSTKN